MNQQELTKLLVDSYKQAPPFIQRFISSGALSKFVEQTRDKYKLHIDVAGRLSDEITMLMVGITDPKEFIQNLAKEAIVPEASLKPIVSEINQKIFVPLREEMRKGTAQMGRNEPLRSSDLRSVLASVTSEVPPVKLLEDHEEPHIEFKKVPTPPPANLPGAIYHPPLPPKPYSADPYREPVE